MWVYLDDMLLVSTSGSKLLRVRDRVLRKLTRAGLPVSNKSELTPRRSMTWVAKKVCREGKCISNSAASIAQCVSFLVHGVLMGHLLWECLRSLVRTLKWVARPRRTLQPFLSSACKGVQARSPWFSRQMLRSLSTAVVFACFPFVPPPPTHATARTGMSFIFWMRRRHQGSGASGEASSAGMGCCKAHSARGGSADSRRQNCGRQQMVSGLPPTGVSGGFGWVRTVRERANFSVGGRQRGIVSHSSEPSGGYFGSGGGQGSE